MKKYLCLLTILMLVFSLSANAMELAPIEGVAFDDITGMCVFDKGIAMVWRLGESAVVNNYGNIVLDYSSTPKAITSNGLIAVLGDNDMIGFFSADGSQVTDYIYDAYIDTHEKTGESKVGYIYSMNIFAGDGNSDLIPVSKNGKFGYINSFGTEVIPFKYEYAYGFKGGLAMICAKGKLSDYATYTEGKYGFIKEDGTEIIAPDSYWVAYPYDSFMQYAVATNGSADTVFIDKNGNLFPYKDGKAPNATFPYVQTNPKEYCYGINDIYGNTVIPAEKTIRPIVVYDDKFLVADTIRNTKNEVIYSAWSFAGLYSLPGSKELLLLKLRDKGVFDAPTVYGVINLDGETVLEPIYSYINYIGDGYLYATTPEEGIIFDTAGNEVFRTQYKILSAYDGFFALNDPHAQKTYIALNPIKRPEIYLDNHKTTFTDAYPYFESERTMIPLRSVFENAGAKVDWDSQTGIVSVEKDGIRVSMKIGEKAISIGDKTFESDVAPVAINNRTYIPLRIFSEGLGMDVKWDGENNRVYINS